MAPSSRRCLSLSARAHAIGLSRERLIMKMTGAADRKPTKKKTGERRWESGDVQRACAVALVAAIIAAVTANATVAAAAAVNPAQVNRRNRYRNGSETDKKLGKKLRSYVVSASGQSGGGNLTAQQSKPLPSPQPLLPLSPPFFFVAGTRPINHRVGRSVRPSVGPSVRRSVRPSVTLYVFFVFRLFEGREM